MAFSTTSRFNQETFYGNSEVSFFFGEKDALSVTIDTERLHIRSVEPSENDCSSYASLFGDQEVMSKYGTGQTKTREEMETRVKGLWVKRWHENDPYSALAVLNKDTDEFLGHVVLGHGDAPGQAELAYLFKKDQWGKGFGTEAVTAVVNEYAPATIDKGYKLEGKVLEKITATARPDNPASIRILEKVGMQKIGEEEKHGAMRHQFSMVLSSLSMELSNLSIKS